MQLYLHTVRRRSKVATAQITYFSLVSFEPGYRLHLSSVALLYPILQMFSSARRISRRDRRLTSTHTMVLAHFCHCPWEAPSSYQIARRLDRWSQTQPVAHTLWSRRAGNSDATDARSIPYQLLRPESSPQARRQESATQVRQRSSPQPASNLLQRQHPHSRSRLPNRQWHLKWCSPAVVARFNLHLDLVVEDRDEEQSELYL